MGQLRLAEAAIGKGDTASAIAWLEQNMAIHRAIGDERMQAITLRLLARLHLDQGDAQLALDCCGQSVALHQALDEPLEACYAAARAALCEIRLGRPEVALPRLNQTLARMDSELADYPAIEMMGMRWACQQALHALGDARASPLLEQLHADVQARATQITDAADRERLIQASPIFRAIVAAHGGSGPIATPV